MSDNSANKRIAINAAVLYIKLIITIVVNFTVARLVLDAIGASDYGLYNVVGGIVAKLNILGSSMVATSYRYMAVEIGKGSEGNPNKVYNTIFIIHAAIAVLLLLIGETLGIFYVENYLNVDSEKIPDALFVLHLSLLTTAFAVIAVPMHGLIIAREKFLFTSVVEILSVLMKLGFITALMFMTGNRLRIYAVMLAIIQLASPVAYQIYCTIKDREVVIWNFNHNKEDYKGVIGFAWWMFVGTTAVMGRTQGAAMIINLFFGTILNAAFGLANQVNSAVVQFTSTLRQAAIPQIMKNQNGNEKRSLSLVYAMSRYSYLAMNIMAIPLLFCMEDVLDLWLGKNIPEYTIIFVIFMLINGMVSNLGAGFDASIQATGKVKKNQMGYSLIGLSLLPIIFILYKLGCPPYINVIVMVLLTIATLVFQIYIMKELTSFSISEYIKQTLIPSLSSTAAVVLMLLPIRYFFPHTMVATFLFLGVSVVFTVLTIFYFGMNKNEQTIIKNLIRTKVLKKVPIQNKVNN